jgi:hypothetical protein
MKYARHKLCAVALVTAAALTTNARAYQGSTAPKLHVSGRFLQDTSNKSVVIHGYMQPMASFFNGSRYSDPIERRRDAELP